MGSHWVLTLLFHENVLYWPEDDRLLSKRVAKMWPECIYNITVNKMGSHWVLFCCTLKMFFLVLKMTVLRSKHFAIMWPECIYNVTVLIYSCILTEYNTLHKFFNTQKDGFCQIHSLRWWDPLRRPCVIKHTIYETHGTARKTLKEYHQPTSADC